MFWKNLWWYIFTVKITLIELRDLKINRKPPANEDIIDPAAEYGLRIKLNDGSENSTALFTNEFQLKYFPHLDEIIERNLKEDGYEWLILNSQR